MQEPCEKVLSPHSNLRYPCDDNSDRISTIQVDRSTFYFWQRERTMVPCYPIKNLLHRNYCGPGRCSVTSPFR